MADSQACHPMRETRVTERQRVGERLWIAGLPAKTIARMVGVHLNTVTNWRFLHNWPPRRQYELRPVEPVQEAPNEEKPTCWVCAGRSATWDGHPSCRGRKVA